MPISFMSSALLTVSLLTNLTVQSIKKLLEGTNVKYSSNILAAVVSVVLAGAVSVIYMVTMDVTFSMKVGVEILILMYLGFLVSTVGYDKVLQTLRQIRDVKEGFNHE